MKKDIHPKYVESTVSCACGNSFKTRSTRPIIKLDICSNCHPFFSGRQKFVDTAGRVERFQKRFVTAAAESEARKGVKPKIAKGQASLMVKKKTVKILSTAPIKTKTTPGARPAAKSAGKTDPAKTH